MSGTSSRSRQNGAKAENATPETQRHKVKQLALKPVPPLPPGPPPERDRGRFSDEHTDRQLASMMAKVKRGEIIATPGGRADGEDRDSHEEEWRAHDRHGPYGQGRRRRN